VRDKRHNWDHELEELGPVRAFHGGQGQVDGGGFGFGEVDFSVPEVSDFLSRVSGSPPSCSKRLSLMA
jgi:hypothetical protein